MGALAEEAGIAVGTVYRYFEDKDQLENELIARMMVSVATRVEQERDPDADPAIRLDALLRAMCHAGLDHLGAVNLFLERSTWTQLGTDHGVVGDAKQAYKRYTKVEQEVLCLLKLKQVHNDTALVFLRASLMAGMTRLAGSGPREQRKRIDEIVRLTTQGLLGCAD